MKLLSSLAFILLATTGPLGFAAPPPAGPPYTAATIVFNHPGPYTQAQLEAAAGMHQGTKFNADDLRAAAQALVDTGFFSSAGAELAPGRYAAITVSSTSSPSIAHRWCTWSL